MTGAFLDILLPLTVFGVLLLLTVGATTSPESSAWSPALSPNGMSVVFSGSHSALNSTRFFSVGDEDGGDTAIFFLRLRRHIARRTSAASETVDSSIDVLCACHINRISGSRSDWRLGVHRHSYHWAIAPETPVKTWRGYDFEV